MITSTQRVLKRKGKHGKMHLISLIDQSTWLHFWTAKKKGKILILVSGGASEQFVNLILDITLGPENPQNGKQFCFHVNVRNISSEDLSGESSRVIHNKRVVRNFDNQCIKVDVNSVLYSHMYHGKKHKFVTQDIQNNQLIKANSGRYFFHVQIWSHRKILP